jgi:hypothetical protein
MYVQGKINLIRLNENTWQIGSSQFVDKAVHTVFAVTVRTTRVIATVHYKAKQKHMADRQ